MEEIEIKTRIKDVMQEKNIPLVKLSEMVGIEKGNLSAVVNDKRNPTLKTLLTIAKALEVDVTELFVKPEKTEPLMKVQFTCPCCGKMYDIEIREHPQQPKEQPEGE